MANTVPALERAIRLMQALANGGESTSLGLARQLGISQSSCYRILQTLVAADWIQPDAADGYVFSHGLLPFVKSLVGHERIAAALQPDLAELAQATGLSVKLSRCQGTEQITLARAESPRPMGVTSPVGARYPVVLGASGACLLSALSAAAIARQIAYADHANLWGHESATELRARLATCRRAGYCHNFGSHPQGIDTLSVPLITAHEGYALTLVGLRGDFAGARLVNYRRRLVHAAAAARVKLEGGA